MSDSSCLGLYTPNGPRRVEIPCRPDEDFWQSIDRYDRRHGTNIYDLYDAGTIELDGRICRNYPPYDPSDEEYVLTGEAIADIAWVFYPSTYWLFDNCAVTETSWGFAVYMQGEDGGIVCQAFTSDEMEADRRALDEGYAPPDGWEDGIGNAICPSNGEQVVSAAQVIHELRKNPLDSKPKPSNRKTGTSKPAAGKTKTSANRKSGTASRKAPTKKPAQRRR